MKDTPEIAEGIRGIEHAVGGEFYENEYVKPYTAAYGEPPLSAFGAFAYDGTMLAALAINKAGSTDPVKVAFAFEGLRITSYNVCYTKLLRAATNVLWSNPLDQCGGGLYTVVSKTLPLFPQRRV